MVLRRLSGVSCCVSVSCCVVASLPLLACFARCWCLGSWLGLFWVRLGWSSTHLGDVSDRSRRVFSVSPVDVSGPTVALSDAGQIRGSDGLLLRGLGWCSLLVCCDPLRFSVLRLSLLSPDFCACSRAWLGLWVASFVVWLSALAGRVAVLCFCFRVPWRCCRAVLGVVCSLWLRSRLLLRAAVARLARRFPSVFGLSSRFRLRVLVLGSFVASCCLPSWSLASFAVLAAFAVLRPSWFALAVWPLSRSGLRRGACAVPLSCSSVFSDTLSSVGRVLWCGRSHVRPPLPRSGLFCSSFPCSCSVCLPLSSSSLRCGGASLRFSRRAFLSSLCLLCCAGRLASVSSWSGLVGRSFVCASVAWGLARVCVVSFCIASAVSFVLASLLSRWLFLPLLVCVLLVCSFLRSALVSARLCRVRLLRCTLSYLCLLLLVTSVCCCSFVSVCWLVLLVVRLLGVWLSWCSFPSFR